MKRCMRCGSELPDHVRFCTECGERSDPAELDHVEYAAGQIPSSDITKEYDDITRREEAQLEREMEHSRESFKAELSSSDHGSSETNPYGSPLPSGVLPPADFTGTEKSSVPMSNARFSSPSGAREEAESYQYGYSGIPAKHSKRRGGKTPFIVIIGIIAVLCLGGVIYAGLQILSSSRNMITESKDKDKSRKKEKDKKRPKKENTNPAEETEEANTPESYQSLIDEIRIPSYWYGSIVFKAISHEEEDYQIDVFGTVDVTADGMHFLELYEYDSIQDEEEPFPVFSLPIEENSFEILPIIGQEDAWILDMVFTEEDEKKLRTKLDNGALDFNFVYSFEEEGEFYEYDCRIFIRDNDDIWDEENDPLPSNFYGG